MECSSDEEETASLLAWMSAKNEVLEEDVDDDFDDFDDDEFVSRPESMRPQTQEKSGSFRVRADFLTPVTDFGELCEEDEVVFAARRNEDFGDSRSPIVLSHINSFLAIVHTQILHRSFARVCAVKL